ncbi:MAG: hypothetical protein K6T78_05590 [Alicyclobacillus sp.]|nr:hypothetical protein [Alicyclobacillus sp.]
MKHRGTKLAVLSSAIAGLAVGGILTYAIPAFASSSPPSTNTSTTSTRQHPASQWLRSMLQRNADEVASDLHLTKPQLVHDLQSGQSLDDIAQKENVSTSQLQSELQTLLQNDLQARVSSGHMTAAREAHLLANLEQRLPQWMANRHVMHAPTRYVASMDVLNFVASQLHITRQQLVSQLKGGASIHQIAAQHGVSATTLQGAVEQKLDAQVNAKVETWFNKTDWFARSTSPDATH